MLAVIALCASGAASAQGFNQFIGFGDSTMDSGYFRYNPTGGSPSLPAGAPSTAIDEAIRLTVAHGGTGAFAGPARVDTEQLAATFGLSALPFIVSGGGGTNYANGSAQAVPTTGDDGYPHGLYNNVPIVTADLQLCRLGPTATPIPTPSYMISYGGNDLIWLQIQAPPERCPRLPYIQSLATRLDHQYREPAGRRRAHHRGARTSMPMRSWSVQAEP